MNFATLRPNHFRWAYEQGVGTITLDRPERKNPLTFESYAELRDTFQNLALAREVKVVVISGTGDNFCSGGDVHEIIGPLVNMDMPGLLRFTTLTGQLIKAIRACPQIVVAQVDGVCAGAGAAVAMASDLRFGTGRSKVAFLFAKVGLAGCDMGACSILPRIIGHGRAAELLYSGRSMSGEEALRWGFYNDLYEPADLGAAVSRRAKELANGPTFAHAMTKQMLDLEWNMSPDAAITAEAQAQAICMKTQDFSRAYHAFVAKQRPVFEGN